MRHRIVLLLALLTAWVVQASGLDLAKSFLHPPAEAKPWVYWFWLNGNITREGITADLEAMARVGIGGVLIMEVDQGTPVGPIPFASPRWRELFAFVCSEADRLGLQVNMNNDAGWCGSGGPWITPEQSMQKLVWTETVVSGNTELQELDLPKPETNLGWYRDAAVLAWPRAKNDTHRIDDVAGKLAAQLRHLPNTSTYGTAPDGAVIDRASVRVLTGLQGDRLEWMVPPGEWVVLRLGHTTTGAVCLPAPASGRGLECDKFSRSAAKAHFDAFIGQLCDDIGALAGRTLVRCHVDSWEVGTQTWSSAFREEFSQRRGYDPLTWLPVVTGRVVDSQQQTERFLWDFRRTISDLICDNYASELARLCRERGLEFSLEGYGEPADDLAYASLADEPMGEFWSYGAFGAESTCTLMASAGHVYGRPIIGAEAFTASDAERWQASPASIKTLGDWAFCEGINRLVFHRYALQPWPKREPGMSMGPWGLHYERTNTWWEDTGAWHEYLSRCQMMLRRGVWAADILYVAPEGAPAHYLPPVRRPSPHTRPGYNFDVAPAKALYDRVSVRGGRLVLPDGVTYQLLALPGGGAYTPELLERVSELVRAGATVVGDRPVASPSLAGFPICDRRVAAVARELWGWGSGPVDRRVGRGRVVSGREPAAVLAGTGLAPDFLASNEAGEPMLRWCHRRDGDTDIYFVSNPRERTVEALASFRVTGRRPEFWWPGNGRRSLPAVWREVSGVTRVPVRLEPNGSVFVIFREACSTASPVSAVVWSDGDLSTRPVPTPPITVLSATYGPAGDTKRTVDVADLVRRLVSGGARSFAVTDLAAEHDPAYNVVKTARISYRIEDFEGEAQASDGQTITLRRAAPVEVLSATYGPEGDAARTIDVGDRVAALARSGRTTFPVVELAVPVDPAPQVVKTLVLEYRAAGVQQRQVLRDGDQVELEDVTAAVSPVRAISTGTDGLLRLEVERPGSYRVELAGGRRPVVKVAPMAPDLEMKGPWQVAFEPGRGAPDTVELDSLVSWSEHPDEGVRHYSGSATYRKRFDLPKGMMARDRRVWLDLGRVEVLAAVALNGRSLGTLWCEPYKVELTDALVDGTNQLEVRVVNQSINRQIGDEFLPEDSERHGNGTLKAWPGWLSSSAPSPSGRFTFTSWRLWARDSTLAPSGLMGPVKLVQTAAARVAD